MTTTIKAALAATLAALCCAAGAEGLSPDYLNLGGVSRHFNEQGDRVTGFNERNVGLGLTWAERDLPVVGKSDVSLGFYHNSERRITSYAVVHKMPIDLPGNGKLGLTFGLATGYQMAPVVPLLAPTACWRYVCAMVIPPNEGKNAGVVSLQFRVPI